MEMAHIPCANIICSKICVKSLLVIYDKIYTHIEEVKFPVSLIDLIPNF
jgi:hypothetical protein